MAWGRDLLRITGTSFHKAPPMNVVLVIVPFPEYTVSRHRGASDPHPVWFEPL